MTFSLFACVNKQYRGLKWCLKWTVQQIIPPTEHPRSFYIGSPPCSYKNNESNFWIFKPEVVFPPFPIVSKHNSVYRKFFDLMGFFPLDMYYQLCVVVVVVIVAVVADDDDVISNKTCFFIMEWRAQIKIISYISYKKPPVLLWSFKQNMMRNI